MTSADVVGVLVEVTVALSAAIACVLLVRGPMRRWFGATVAYAAWAVAPVAIIAVLLPAMAVPVLPAAQSGLPLAAGSYVASATTMAAGGHWLVTAWLCGAVAMATRLGLQQRAFLRSLGALRSRPDGTLQADTIAGLPAVFGLLRPRTVLPADFQARYTPAQQDLLRSHERGHIERGDLWANAMVAVLRCIGWFNPLVHLAARCFRHDQELACDQRVLAAHPGARRAYGEAMVNTQLAAQPLPIGCHWGFGHPLTERIAMLKQPLPSRRRWIAGATLVTALTSFAGVAAWAAQPPAKAPVENVAPAGADTATRALHPPRYPAAAIAQDITGKVVLLIDIDARGNPTAVAVERSEPAGVFEAEAAAAAWKWTFTPAIENGRPVASQVRVPVEFEADGTPPGDAGGAMGWMTPEAPHGAIEMECDAARGDSEGGAVACGNLLTENR